MFAEAEKHFLTAAELMKSVPEDDPVWAEAHRGFGKTYLAMRRLDEAMVHAHKAWRINEMCWGAECGQSSEDCFLLGEILSLRWDYDRAKSWYERCLFIRSRDYGDAHDTSLEVLSRLVLIALQAKQKFGIEQIHARAFQAYQQRYPSGDWAKFLRLADLTEEYAARNELQSLQDMFKTETQILRKMLGNNHKEVASVITCEAQALKSVRQNMAAWSLKRKVETVERAKDEALFAQQELDYALPRRFVVQVLQLLMAQKGPLPSDAPEIFHYKWWQIEPASNENEVLASLTYNDGSARAEIRLQVVCTERGPFTTVTYRWRLSNSARITAARGIVNFTVREFDANIKVASPESLSRLSAQSMPPSVGGGVISGASGSAGWPTPQQFNEAVQNPRTAFSDPDLQVAAAEQNALGLPKPYSGAFATIYRLQSESGNWAVKCFTQRIHDQLSRYETVQNFLRQSNLPYFVSCDYQPEGTTIGGAQFPVLKMPWLSGVALHCYVESNLYNPDKLVALARRFLEMCAALRKAGIAHGDLQHGNILVHNDQIVLVDYDAMYVPNLFGKDSNEIGHRNYQHPARDAEYFDTTIDNFSIWVIYCSLICLSRRPQLWETLQAGDESLLFKQSDFVSPEQSYALRLLTGENEPQLKGMGRLMFEISKAKLRAVPGIDDLKESGLLLL